MVLCFHCSVSTKRYIDDLLQTGRYPNLSELIAVALSNQALLDANTSEEGKILLGDSPLPEQRTDTPSDRLTGTTEPEPRPSVENRRSNGVSELFTRRPSGSGGPVAEPPADLSSDSDAAVPPSRWLFGQYNRLLPAKASCRALANLLVDGRGIDALKAAKKIASEATELGNHFRMLDRRYERRRDEMMSTAFPGLGDPDKGRLRFASQFVGSIDKQGRLSGLLVDLKLINRVTSREPRISLTAAGWQFASLKNPILDSEGDADPAASLSPEERSFVLAHIAACVPRERSAYQVILSAIANGQNTPESISEVLRNLEKSDQESDSMIATQRSGAISRMSDLALLVRDRDGIRVRYALTDEGTRFLDSRSLTAITHEAATTR